VVARRPRSPIRVRLAHVEHIFDQLTARDREILKTLNRVRLATGSQLQRLHFSDLSGKSAAVVRWRVLKRLVEWRVIVPTDRRIGGSLRGSSEMAFALDTAGQRILQMLLGADGDITRLRRPGIPGALLLRHTLAVTELYVRLVEHTKTGGISIDTFHAEPSAWLPDGLGGWLKPDAYMVLRSASYVDDWAIEVDRATESVPTLKRKLLAYLDFFNRGQRAPSGVMPRVLIVVQTEARHDAVAAMLRQLPKPAELLFVVTIDRDALLRLLGSQKE
jgi:hypothetical protein